MEHPCRNFHKLPVIFVISVLSILLQYSVALAQSDKKIQMDTIVVVNIDTLVVHDTITSYFKIHVPIGASILQNYNNNNSEFFSGMNTGIGLTYVRNKLFFASGLKYSFLNGNTYSDSLYNRFIQQRDTTFNLFQEVNGQIVITPIATTYEYIDSVLIVNQLQNTYSLVQFPVTIGYVFDRGKWSFLNGMGVLFQVYSPINNTNLVELRPKPVYETNYIRRFHAGIQATNQTLYYLNSQFSVGLQFDVTYFPISIYTSSYSIPTRRFCFDAGLVLSYIL
jgi:hypothetical protein